MSCRRRALGAATQREIDGSRLKKYNHTKVCSAISARCDAPHQPSVASANKNPSRTVQKYHMKPQASFVKPMGADSLRWCMKCETCKSGRNNAKPILVCAT